MKKQLFNILPNWLKVLKHADKIAHAIYGTLFYLFFFLFFPKEIALFLTFALAVIVEYLDRPKMDFHDVIATLVIPIIIYVL
jgi:hypothetical protein